VRTLIQAAVVGLALAAAGAAPGQKPAMPRIHQGTVTEYVPATAKAQGRLLVTGLRLHFEEVNGKVETIYEERPLSLLIHPDLAAGKLPPKEDRRARKHRSGLANIKRGDYVDVLYRHDAKGRPVAYAILNYGK
jgi:hypothetical protein